MTKRRVRGWVTGVLARSRILVVAPAVLLAVVLTFHPRATTTHVYDQVGPHVGVWLAIHMALPPLFALMGVSTWLLLEGVRSGSATVARVAVVVFVVGGVAWEANGGIATGVLVQHASALPTRPRADVANAIQALNDSRLSGDRSPFAVAAVFGWVIAMGGAAAALPSSGADRKTVVLIAGASLLAVHPPPTGPAGALCFAVAGWRATRDRSRAQGMPVPAHAVGKME